MGYAIENKQLLAIDFGDHFHPTESIADKLSSVLMYVDDPAAVSRGRCAGQRSCG